MTTFRTLLVRAAAVAAVLIPFGNFADAASTPTQATKLLDITVLDARGKRVGVSSDVVFDLEKAQVIGLEVSHATPSGTEREIYPLRSLQMGDKTVLRAGTAPIPPAPEMISLTKLQQTVLNDMQGKKAGDITDVLLTTDDSKVAGVVIRFDPAWLKSDLLAAVPPSSIERKGEELVAKFESSYVRPADSDKKLTAAPPPPPPPAPRARLSQLPGTSIVDANGRPLATIDDVLVDLPGKRIAGLSVRDATGQPATLAFPQPNLKFNAGKLVSSTGLDGLTKGAPSNATPGRQALATRIVNPAGNPAGKVEDMVADMNDGKLQFAVASFIPDWMAAGWIAAVPVRAVTPDKSGQPAMTFTLNDINYAFLFQASQWPDITNEQVRAAIHAKVDNMK
jgi:sporulation protein YlmC with PRC-barrel domain